VYLASRDRSLHEVIARPIRQGLATSNVHHIPCLSVILRDREANGLFFSGTKMNSLEATQFWLGAAGPAEIQLRDFIAVARGNVLNRGGDFII
jgi:hypothetical protein